MQQLITEFLQSTFLFSGFPYSSNALFEREPLVTWELPEPLQHLLLSCSKILHTDDDAVVVTTTNTTMTMGIIPLDPGFWICTFVLLSLQALMNMTVALVTYFAIVQTQDDSTRLLIGYGVLVPCLLILPPVLCAYYVEFQSLTLMLCLLGGMPNKLALAVIEAIHQCLPTYATTHQDKRMLVLYFSSTLQLKFDPHTHRPVPFTPTIFWNKLASFMTVFVQTSLLFSLLLPYNYQVFPQHHTNTSILGTLVNLYSWGNLANGFLMASITSLVLDGGASGLGLVTSICTGYTMEDFSDAPLTSCTSVSDFWRKWDRPVQSSLRNGCYRPLRKATLSSSMAAVGTFVASGLIHEYMVAFMTLVKRDTPYQPAYGNQFLFFLWNAVVMMLERYYYSPWFSASAVVNNSGTSSNKWYHLPQPIRTALVLLTVLPIAFLFTDEYVQSSFYTDAVWAFPLVVVKTTTRQP
ncbi:expressed unknown protein [Seminavis robusta]|uniref:Wax synthase domain-containing protein n=1 Tax=Seminavis robusta TaxID=568900 RepID=A0A9N8EP38_9STRA|nr:expressed unknown protein [Seminavis robusta]|eukprot:Sro1568_g283030.1 n/a (465) ;mRNA; r:5477-6945